MLTRARAARGGTPSEVRSVGRLAQGSHSGVLPQPRTLERAGADTPGQARNGRREMAPVQHAREERSDRQSDPSPPPGEGE